MPRRLSALLIAFFLVFVGCAQDEDPALEPPAATEDGGQAADGPAITITSPENDARVKAGDIEIEVEVANFDIVNKLGQRAADGEGHIHYYFDVDRIPTTPGKPAVTKDDSTYHADARTSHTWKDVDTGVHNFAVQLVNNDHTPLDPPVTARTTVSVRK